MPPDLAEATAAEIADAVRAGATTALTVTEAALARIEDLNPRLNAFTDVTAERELLATVNVFAFVYPLWMNAQPAMMKGYIDRVFGMGFGYAMGRGGNVPLLKSRKMISFTSSGAPTDWIKSTGAWSAIQKLFDEHFAAVCGLELIDHIHFGGVTSGIRSDVVEGFVVKVREAVRRLGGEPDTGRSH